MAACVYESICKLLKYDGENCANETICRFFSEILTTSDVPKKKNTDDDDDIVESGPTKKEVIKARAKIGRLHGRLDENQIKAVESLEGKHFSALTVVQRQQIIDIAKAL